MAFVDPATPNQADFDTFVYAQGVNTSVLPTTSTYLPWAFTWGVNWTNTGVNIPSPAYVLACYQGGMHYLVSIAQDEPGQTFWADLRKQYNMLSFVAGAVISSSDQGTSQTLSGSKGLEDLSLVAMDAIKTPWGQKWLQYQQTYGPNVIGVA